MVIIYEAFDTWAQAEAFKQEYYKQYHPAGYGTFLSINEKYGKFVVSGSRGSSCD